VSEPLAVEEAPLVVAELPGPPDSLADQTLARRDAVEHRESPSDQEVVEPPARPFTTFWEFAVAVNRSDPAALALAGNGNGASEIPIDGVELRKLLGMMWFRTALARLSRDWRDRILDVLVDSATVPDHAVKLGRQTVHLRDLSYEQLQEIGARTIVPDWIQPDLDLLVTVGRFWGSDALTRLHFVEAPERQEPSMMESLLQKFRS
jgi:hypothetical protein